MRTLHLLPLVLTLVAGCGKGVSSFADASSQGAATMNDYAATIESIKDKSSAEAAKPKLEAIAKRMGDIVAAMKDLSPPSSDEMNKTNEAVRNAMQGVSKQVTAFMERNAANPEVMKTVGDAWGAVNKQLMPLRAMLDV